MEPHPAPPPLSAPTGAAVSAYPDSVDSSPRSRNNDSWDESLYPTVAGGSGGGGGGATAALAKLRLMCSYGGHIVPRPHDKSLCYVGGDTRIVVVDPHTTLSDLTHRLSKTLLPNRSSSFTLKYQLPNEDLDSLISVTTDEDLENMIDEYERLNSATTANKSSRLRLFLFPTNPESASSIGSLLENSTKSEDWFLNALNGAPSGFSDSSSVNCLLGLDDDVAIPGKMKDVEAQIQSFGNVKGVGGGGGGSSKNLGQDVHSVPDSPMLETTSSFGSASSSPSVAYLPPIRVQVEDQKVGIEEQFSQTSVQQKQDDSGFAVISSPPTVLITVPAETVTGLPMSSSAVIPEYPNRVFSDDERSEQGLQMGYRKPPQQQPQPQSQPLSAPQFQQKQSAGLDLASPDSVSSDGSLTNPLSQKRMIYQDSIVQIPSVNIRASANPIDPNIPDPNSRIQMQQQIQDSGYLMRTQFDPQHPQLHHQQQFIHSGAQYIQHHPSGALPMASYYQLYPSQQQQHPHHPGLDQQNFVYYMPTRQAQGYNLSMQQPSYSEASPTLPPTHNQTPPPSAATYTAARNAAATAPKPELPAGVYRTTNSAGPQLIQIPSSQHQPQYVGYSQIHHPSQSVTPASGATGNYNYGYEFTDPTPGHIYYAQPMPPQSAAQYQTMTSALPETGSHLQTDNNIKQQVRTSQP